VNQGDTSVLKLFQKSQNELLLIVSEISSESTSTIGSFANMALLFSITDIDLKQDFINPKVN